MGYCEIKPLIILNILLSAIGNGNPALASDDCDFPAIFNFGDSNSDTGGLSASLLEVVAPNGETFFHHPAGRLSDGRLIIDFIAQSIGLPYLHPYLDAVEANFRHGANFATTASTIVLPNVSLSVRILKGGYSPFSLSVQAMQFSQLKSRSQRPYNRKRIFEVLLPKKDYFSRALYTVDIGQNDLTAENFLSKTPEEAAVATTNLMNQFTTSIKAIYDEGARSFWIHNTGPIGCLAYVLSTTNFTESQIDKVGCAIPWNDIAQNFNKRLNETVVQLRMDLPLAAFTYVDVFSVKYSLFSNAERLGFKQPLVVCCGSGGKYNLGPAFCGSSVVVNGTKLTAESCQDPSVKINWDGVHYTEAANKWVFDQIASGAFSDPPIPLKMACKK